MAPSKPFYLLSLSSGLVGIASAAAAGERHTCPRAGHRDGVTVVTVTQVLPVWKRLLLKEKFIVLLLARSREIHTSSLLGEVSLLSWPFGCLVWSSTSQAPSRPARTKAQVPSSLFPHTSISGFLCSWKVSTALKTQCTHPWK